jgi:hypothetical protein
MRVNRNQCDVKVGDHTFTLRSTFDFLDACADDMDTLRDYLLTSSSGITTNPSRDLLRSVFNILQKANINPIDAEQIKTAITDAGLFQVAPALQDFYFLAYYGGEALERIAALNAEKNNTEKKITIPTYPSLDLE